MVVNSGRDQTSPPPLRKSAGRRVQYPKSWTMFVPARLRAIPLRRCLETDGELLRLARQAFVWKGHRPGLLFRSMKMDKLSRYQAKRDFTKTAEPSGTARASPPSTSGLSSRSMLHLGCTTISGSKWTE